MKYLILLIFSRLLFACSNGKRVYWCGDHACINNKEKESYFKKTMIVEVRELSKQNKKSKSELEIIKKQKHPKVVEIIQIIKLQKNPNIYPENIIKNIKPGIDNAEYKKINNANKKRE